MISSAFAQTYPSASIILVDNNYSGPTPYSGTIYGGYQYGGIPYLLSGSVTFNGLTLNSLNPVLLPWTLPIDTDENIYILRVVAVKSGAPSSPSPAYSSWFNSSYYLNNYIAVTVRFN